MSQDLTQLEEIQFKEELKEGEEYIPFFLPYLFLMKSKTFYKKTKNFLSPAQEKKFFFGHELAGSVM